MIRFGVKREAHITAALFNAFTISCDFFGSTMSSCSP